IPTHHANEDDGLEAKEKKLESLAADVADLERQLTELGGDPTPPAGTGAAAGELEALLPMQSFQQSILGQRGSLGGRRNLHAYQNRVMEHVKDWRREGEAGCTVLISMADSAGKTTAGLYACMQALLERGETALFVSASPEDSEALYRDFEGCRATGIWGWSIRAVQGRHGIVDAEQKRQPVQLLFADIETIHEQMLPFDRQTALMSFIQALGVVVIEDMDQYPAPRAAHASFIFRRLAEMFKHREVAPVTIATTRPIFAHDSQYCRGLLGPLARKLREELSMADDAPIQPQMAHVLVPGRDLVMEQNDQIPSWEHLAAAIVQAAGYPSSERSIGDELMDQVYGLDTHAVQTNISGVGGAEDGPKSTWPTALVGWEGFGAASDDRVIGVYRAFGLTDSCELQEDQDGALSVVYPFNARTFAGIEGQTHHAGVQRVFPQQRPSDAAHEGDTSDNTGEVPPDEERQPEQMDEEAQAVSVWEPGSPAFEHLVFLMLIRGPEPVDEFLAWLVGRGSALPDGTITMDGFHDLLRRVRPENLIPRRNTFMNRLHFEATMQEREIPGHNTSFLYDTFDRDVFETITDRLDKRGQLDRSEIQSVDRHRMRLKETEHLWAPRSAAGHEMFDAD
ncbi:MAG: hypothetical protein VX938_14125, partial [Myxococcota bacterium]|nr:hypothetical protein [Myxococcota bacterium]